MGLEHNLAPASGGVAENGIARSLAVELITYPGHHGGGVDKRERPPCMIERGTSDGDWISFAAKAERVVVGRDRYVVATTDLSPDVEFKGCVAWTHRWEKYCV